MNFSYKEYCKDNPEGYWFKRKTYGWGWVPVKKEGWLCILAFLFWIGLAVVFVLPQNILLYFVSVILGIVLLILVCYKKGEKPRWQWGSKK